MAAPINNYFLWYLDKDRKIRTLPIVSATAGVYNFSKVFDEPVFPFFLCSRDRATGGVSTTGTGIPRAYNFSGLAEFCMYYLARGWTVTNELFSFDFIPCIRDEDYVPTGVTIKFDFNYI